MAMDEKEINRVFAKKLKMYLAEYNMRQYELAKRLGVGSSTVSDWIHGIKTPRMSKVDAMCKIFNCTRSDFLDDPKDDGCDPIEKVIIDRFRSMNDEGKHLVVTHIEFIASQPQYKKRDLPKMVEESS